MKRVFVLLSLLLTLSAGSVNAQTAGTRANGVEFVTSLPATCSPAQGRTVATVGPPVVYYVCTATDTWSQYAPSTGGGGTPGGASGDYQTNNGSGGFGAGNINFTANVSTLTRNNIGQTSTDGFAMVNSTAAAAGAQQFSPRLRFTASGWKTNATAGAQTLDWGWEAQAVQGGAAPNSRFVIQRQINGAGFTNHSIFAVSEGSTAYALFPGGSELNWPGLALGLNFGTDAAPVVNGFYADPGGSWLITRPANNFATHGSGLTLLSGGQIRWVDNTTSIPTGTVVLGIEQATARVAGFTDGTNAAVSRLGGTWRARPTTPAQIVADANNYNPGGVSYFQRWSTDASRQITGLTFTATQVDGQVHQIWNNGAQDIVLVHESASSLAANRFRSNQATNLTILPDNCANLIYDAGVSRWRASLCP
ncbi:MAG TPA: hypothetical protein VGB07_36140 [Blastocatellia bacterium]